MSTTLNFPDNFIWGTATAAYQIEGAVHADGRGMSIWDSFLARPGNSVKGEDGSTACDHYNRIDEDLDLLGDMGMRHYRFSIAWPRIFPNGKPPANSAGMDFYQRLVDGLLERGITPWATLYHWDLPQALQALGGWHNRDIVGRFCDYADMVSERLGDRVDNWMIINEPSVSSLFGHGFGTHAPGLRGEDSYLKAAHHHNLVIGTVFDLLKAKKPDWSVGSTYTRMPVRGVSDSVPDDIVAGFDAAWNGNFFDPLMLGTYPENMKERMQPHIHEGDMDAIRTDLDFVGIQHYSPVYARESQDGLFGADFAEPPGDLPRTAMGWSIEPEGFYETLATFRDRYGEDQAMIITENGIALRDQISADGKVHDHQRIAYYQSYIAQLHHAIADGVKVEGYFAWSLMDNLEWAEGYDMRFGLTYIDFGNKQQRIPKDSFAWFADVAGNNRLELREEFMPAA